MVEITCFCGHTANCSAFIDMKKINRWLRCPSCKIRFSSPKFPEVGVQVIDDHFHSGGFPKTITVSDRVEREIRLWERDQILKKMEENEQFREAQERLRNVSVALETGEFL